MATYLRGISDAVPQVTPFTPDFTTMQKALTTLQSRYEQGFASVKNTYNQVLNAPLSDALNKTTRDKFIKDAEQQLKNLSSVDLSLAENQQTAENVFAPFWQDNMILQDASTTKWYQSELQRAMATRDSQDEKVRSQYSDAAVTYLQNGLEKLQLAGRDPSKYAKLERRRFVPFQNMKAYLNEQAEKQKLEVVWESAEGPYLIKRENGERSQQAFETFADNMLGDQFQDQFHVMGVVDKEERIRQMKKYNPALTDEQAMTEIAKSIGSEYKTGLTSRSELLQKQYNKVSEDMKPYLSQKQLDDKQRPVFAELAQQQLLLEKQLKSVKDQLSDTKAAEFQKNIEINADSYFTNIMRQRAVKGWASARAAAEKVSVTTNTAWTENNRIAQTQRELDLRAQEVGIRAKQLELNQWVAEHPYAKQGPRLGTDDDGSDSFGGYGSGGIGGSGSIGGGSYSGGGYGGVDLMNPEKAGVVDGISATDPKKLGNPYQIFQERQLQRWGVAHNELFDDRSGGTVLRSLGISTPDTANYMRAMRAYSMDVSGSNLSKQEQGWLRDLTKKLTGKETGTFDSFFQLRDKLLNNMQNTLRDKLKEGGPGLNEEDTQMLSSYLTATQAIREYDSLDEQRSKLIQDIISKDPKAYSKILINKNGKLDVADVDDVVKDFKPVKIKSLNSGEVRTLGSREFAELYLSGKINIGDSRVNLSIDNEPFDIVEFDGRKGHSMLSDADPAMAFFNYAQNRRYEGRTWTINEKPQMIDTNPNALDVKYGSPWDQKHLRDKLNAAVVPNLPEFQSQTGGLGVVVRYDLAQKGKRDVATRLIQEAAQDANHMGIYVDGELSKKSSVNDAIMRVMQLGEPDLKDYVSTVLLKPGPTGRPSLQLVLQPVKSSDKTKISQEDLETLAGLKSIELELNPNASGETLRKIRYNSGNYIFGSLLHGKPLPPDPILAAAGFDCSITPNDPVDPTYAIVEVKSKEFVNGAYRDAPLVRKRFYFSEITPDELVHSMHSFAIQQINKGLRAQQLYRQQMGQSGTAQPGQSLSPAEILESIRKNMGA